MWMIEGRGAGELVSDDGEPAGVMENECHVLLRGPAMDFGERPEATCLDCDWSGDESDLEVELRVKVEQGGLYCPECGSDDIDRRTRAPIEWLNWADVTIGADGVTFGASVGDPRGGFTWTLRRNRAGELLMHVPYPGETTPHEGLVEIHAGTYVVGTVDPGGGPRWISQGEARGLLLALKALVEPCECHGRERGEHGRLCMAARDAIERAGG